MGSTGGETTVPEPEGRVRNTGQDAAQRGRDADWPIEIPSRGWWDVARRTVRQVRSDDVPRLAASIAFYAMLALFPALIAVVSVYGLVADPRDVRDQIESFTSALPEDASRLITEQLGSITRQSGSGLGVGVVVGIGAALWTAAGGVKALIKGINTAYDEAETRPFVRLRALALLLTVCGVVGVVVMLGLIVAVPPIVRRLAGDGLAPDVLVALRWPLLGVLILVGLIVVYRIAPNREPARWRWVSWGAVVAAVVWMLASVGFSIYVDAMGSYNETYGSIGAVIVLMLWLWLSAFAVLMGAEFNAEMERQTTEDTTTGPPRPMGERGAYAADTLGDPARTLGR